MDLILSLAVSLGLYSLVVDHLPPDFEKAPIPSLVTAFSAWDTQQDLEKVEAESNLNVTGNLNTYDYIVVGAGSAGAVVANRLSESFRVLLLEAGGEPNPLQSVPLLAFNLAGHQELDYMYRTLVQNASCQSHTDRESRWSRGKGLGGSSNLNCMVYLRGHPADYDNWAAITRDDRWSYRALISYFKKAENYCFDCEASGDVLQWPYHNQGGPLQVSRASYKPLVSEFLKAAEWNGIPTVDMNGPHHEGASSGTNTCSRAGIRSSTFTAYLEPIRATRTSLTISKYSKATEILFHEDGLTAVGVKYVRHGKPMVAYASGEVVLSAGAIDSPKLLMMSGIGPKARLEAIGIPVRVNSPVGLNLQDHIGTFPGPFLIDRPSSFLADRDLADVEPAVASWLSNGTGPLSMPCVQANAVFSSSRAIRARQWPDTQLMFMGFGTHSTLAGALAHFWHIRPEVLAAYYDPVLKQDGFQLLVTLGRPKSRGQLWLNSSDPDQPPVISPNYFGQPIDVRVLVEGLKRAVHLSENGPAFKALGARLSPIPFPSCTAPVFRSDAYWECLLRHQTFTIFHYAGTTAMGPRDSPSSVVDPELRVIGLNRLRVVDTGIMPFLVNVNTNGAAILIGERGSDFIKEEAYKRLRFSGR